MIAFRLRIVMKKWIFIFAVVIVAVGAGIYLYLNQPRRAIGREISIDITAASLFESFQNDEPASNTKYLNKVLSVHGTIISTSVNTDGKTVIVLDTGDNMFGINCTLDKTSSAKAGDEVIVKGICTGYLSDVVLTQALIEQ